MISAKELNGMLEFVGSAMRVEDGEPLFIHHFLPLLDYIVANQKEDVPSKEFRLDYKP